MAVSAEATAKGKKKHRLRSKLLLAAGSLVFFLGLLEVGTRLLWKGQAYDYQAIAIRGANARVVLHGVEYQLNDLEIRDRHAVPKAAGTRRVLLLGDSFVFGDGAPESETIAAKLEPLLNAPAGSGAATRTEVINTGNGGFNTKDELEQLRRLAPHYEPDAVVLFFFTNDVLEVAPPAARGGAQGKPTSFRQRAKEFLRRRSKFCAFVYFELKTRLSGKFGVPRNLLPPDYFDLDDSKPGWVAFKESLKSIRDLTRASNTPFLFVMIPTLTTLNERYPFQEMRMAVRDYAQSLGLTTIDLFDALSALPPADLWVDSENTHWNGKGTGIAAETIVGPIEAMLGPR